jgi:NADH dehydrogenase/NADH:ubiquinone oxidoreductase subunit G
MKEGEMITIDGKIFTAQEGDTILKVARKAGIHIPTLCYKEWIEPHGACRLCSVEITRPSWNSWCKVVTACNHPAQDGLIVYTASERILNVRKTLLDLLLARCPETPLIQKLSAEYGITKTSLVPREKPDDCILCGLCIYACEAVGAYAITTISRGIWKEVATPFQEGNDACIGCASCAQVCPTNFIKYEDKDKMRHIWHRDFKMLSCSSCGRAFITERQMEHFAERSNLPRSYFEKCELCHKKETAQKFWDISNPG